MKLTGVSLKRVLIAGAFIIVGSSIRSAQANVVYSYTGFGPFTTFTDGGSLPSSYSYTTADSVTGSLLLPILCLATYRLLTSNRLCCSFHLPTVSSVTPILTPSFSFLLTLTL